uniref:Uncharacterized protein n=1 Tax=Candidatus Kentrum sp. TC TaxID=2126339 RepID=A0A450Y7Z0_9GAMM|nr:MAG: hypothetical protein BECKTC1821E_GA0114239_100154 [Candidatus Kentron sp. TC]
MLGALFCVGNYRQRLLRHLPCEVENLVPSVFFAFIIGERFFYSQLRLFPKTRSICKDFEHSNLINNKVEEIFESRNIYL